MEEKEIEIIEVEDIQDTFNEDDIKEIVEEGTIENAD